MVEKLLNVYMGDKLNAVLIHKIVNIFTQKKTILLLLFLIEIENFLFIKICIDP